MKISTMLAVFVLGTSASAFAQQEKEQQYTIQGELHQIKDPAKAYLFYQTPEMHKDSALVKDGRFVFKGTVSRPLKAFIILAQNNTTANAHPMMDQVAVYLENGVVMVNSPDSLKHAKVGGTQLNRDQQDYINAMGNIRELQADVTKKVNATTDAKTQEALRGDYAQLDVLLQTSQATFIQSHPKSVVALNVLRAYIRPSDNFELASQLFGSLSDSLRNTPQGEMYAMALKNVTKIEMGKVAPDFVAQQTDGKEMHLSELRGKYVLLDFWASWCGPCRRESPNLVTSYEQFKNKNFTILSFSVDEDAAAWKKAVLDDKYVWNNVASVTDQPGAVAKLYNVNAIPVNYLLDPSGKVIAMNLRGDMLQKKLAEILN